VQEDNMNKIEKNKDCTTHAYARRGRARCASRGTGEHDIDRKPDVMS